MSDINEQDWEQSIRRDIETLNVKMDNLKYLKTQLNAIEDDEAEVIVRDRPDSSAIHITITSSSILPEMKAINRLSMNLTSTNTRQGNIEYNLTDELFIMERTFRLDR